MNKVNDNNKLAIQMLIAMVSGILVGLLFMAVRQFLGAQSAAWSMINNILFQDITAKGAKVKTLVIPTNEEYMIALDTLNLTK